jgi:hypothetical protein
MLYSDGGQCRARSADSIGGLIRLYRLTLRLGRHTAAVQVYRLSDRMEDFV